MSFNNEYDYGYEPDHDYGYYEFSPQPTMAELERADAQNRLNELLAISEKTIAEHNESRELWAFLTGSKYIVNPDDERLRKLLDMDVVSEIQEIWH